ncbi:MAG: SPOR domain-containing protein [Gammaproteobacteria bacterium]
MAENNFSLIASGRHENSNASSYTFITRERTQKFDLLIHLISNLQQPLVLCGPEGIGKTKFLKNLQEQMAEAWEICYVQGSIDLNFESIEKLLSRISERVITLDHTNALSHEIDKNKSFHKVILLLDDAGCLIPGLLTSLCQYAKTRPQLRMIFSLTPNEVHVKNSTDSAIADCHFIEIPPLTEKQCEDFLQNLSVKPGSAISYHAINASLTEKVYKETHGIPGRIIDAIPKISVGVKSRPNSRRPVLLIFAPLLLVAAVSYLLWQEEDKPEKSAATVKQTISKIELSPPQAGFQRSLVDSTQPELLSPQEKKNQSEPYDAPAASIGQDVLIVNKTTKEFEDKLPALEQDGGKQNRELQTLTEVPAGERMGIVKTIDKTSADDKEKSLENKSMPSSSEESFPEKYPTAPTAKEVLPGTANDGFEVISDKDWFFKQPPTHYTWQLMVLSSKDSALKFKQKYKIPELEIAFFHSMINGKDRYTLVYGSFASLQEAKKGQMKLPAALKKAWLRKFRTLQGQITQ